MTTLHHVSDTPPEAGVIDQKMTPFSVSLRHFPAILSICSAQQAANAPPFLILRHFSRFVVNSPSILVHFFGAVGLEVMTLNVTKMMVFRTTFGVCKWLKQGAL